MLLIFDLDGTLGDTDDAMNRIVADILQQKGLPLSLEEVAENRDFLGMGEFEKFRAFAGKYGMGWTAEQITEMGLLQECKKQALYEENGVTLYDGARDALEELKRNGYEMCIGSSNPSDRSRAFISHQKLSNIFGERVYGLDHVEGKTKPDPSIFRMAFDKHAHHGPAIVIEDSKSGVEAANALRLPALLYNPSQRDTGWNIAGSFSHYRELPALIRQFR